MRSRKHRVVFVSEKTLATHLKEWRETISELIAISFMLLLTGISLGIVLVGAFRLRMWLG